MFIKYFFSVMFNVYLICNNLPLYSLYILRINEFHWKLIIWSDTRSTKNSKTLLKCLNEF